MDPQGGLETCELRWGTRAPHHGALVVFCGGDGAGKTTQIGLLRDRLLRDRAEVAVCTRQPTEWYRSDPLVRSFLRSGGEVPVARALALFAAADRLRHCHEVIMPALRQGRTVLCDRYVYSSLVYFARRGVPPHFVAEINAGIPKPDLAVWLDVPPERTLARIRSRDGASAKFEESSIRLIAEVAAGFAALGRHLVRVDGCSAPQSIHEQVWALCRPFLGTIAPA